MDALQLKYLNSETLFQVDENDRIIGKLSKYDAHRLNGETGKAPLHRAFSVFLWTEEGQLLLQRRSHHKITFPLMWSNTCCSHPIAEFEGECEGLQGAVKAAIRKLEHELGIPKAMFNADDFKFFGRIIYDAKASDEWGEHELDYILFARIGSDVIDVIRINENEVAEYRLLALNQLSELPVMTPWLKMIYESGNLIRWFEEFKNGRISESSSGIQFLK